MKTRILIGSGCAAAIAALLVGGPIAASVPFHDGGAGGALVVSIPGEGTEKAQSVRLYSASHALVVSVGKDAGGRPARNAAAAEATRVADALRHQGFSVTTLADPNGETLRTRLRQFLSHAGSDPDARLVVWFAGLGAEAGGTSYLVPADAPAAADGRFAATALPLPELAGLYELASARHVLTVLDTCVGSPGPLASPGTATPAAALSWQQTLPGRQFLFRCQPASAPADGALADAFVKAIGTASPADANTDGLVTGNELAGWLAKTVPGTTYAVSGRSGFANGDAVFRLPASPRRDGTKADDDDAAEEREGTVASPTAVPAKPSLPGGRLTGAAPPTTGAPAPEAMMEPAPADAAMAPMAPPPPPSPQAANGLRTKSMAPAQGMTVGAAPSIASRNGSGGITGGTIGHAPVGGVPPHLLDRTQPPSPDRERYENAPTNPVKVTSEQPVSTFSIDVDTASYANVRRFLREGRLPPRDAVRIEEMVNYFSYDYPLPEDKAAPFRASVTVMPTPWNAKTKLLHIGIKGYDIVPAARPRSNLVFLLDTSGSMMDKDRLPLLKQALRLVVQEMTDQDTVGIVAYAGSAGVVLEPTSGKERHKILAAMEQLEAGGSTAGGQGILAAYGLAERTFDKAAVNRVILGTDGDFNVGVSDPKRLEDLVSEKRKTGVYLSVLGFGAGNYNDVMMQTLAQKGNGNAAYIDNLAEARKVLVDEMAGTLFPIADDVKIQVEFNPARVAEYRLIGYETRMLKREDFNNDQVDAGEIGSGHSVTALYEITPPGSGAESVDPLRYGKGGKEGTAVAPATTGEYAFLRLRFKLPGEKDSKLIERPIGDADAVATTDALGTEPRFAAAVAAFAQLLRRDPFLKEYGYQDVVSLAQPARGQDPFGHRAEFVQLVRAAQAAQPSAKTRD